MDISLDFTRDEIYECGAALLAVLACPKASDDAKRADLLASLCGKAIWIKHIETQNLWIPVLIKPGYVFRDPKQIDRDVKSVARRVGERMVAGRMAVPFFWRTTLGDAMTLPKDIKRLSVNQLAEYVLEDAGQADAENVEKRYWRPSLPVIHLATAAAVVGQQWSKAGRVIGLETFLFQRDLVESVVRQAEELEGLIEKDRLFPAKAEQLVRVRLA